MASLVANLLSWKKKDRKNGEELKKFRTGIKVRDDKSFHPITDCDAEAVERSTRKVPPAHYTIKVNDFSYLMDGNNTSYVSNIFEVDGYKWRLSLFPCGNKKQNGGGHISLYLEIVDTDGFPPGWEVHAAFKFFVHDQIRDEYLTIQDAGGRIRRFHGMKTEWGFACALPLMTIKNLSKGYVVGNSCSFGVEVFVSKCSGKGESLTLSWKPLYNADQIHAWKIEKFSSMNETFYYSHVFTLMECNWKFKLFPRGPSGREKSLALILELDGWETSPTNQKLFFMYRLSVKDQKDGNHMEKRIKDWFNHEIKGFGARNFMLLDDLKDKSKGFLVNDALIVEVRIDGTAAIQSFPSETTLVEKL